jgi:hypothetical protein
MPADVKTSPDVSSASLEGATFTCQNDHDRVEAIDQAFDYRGDVTLQLHNGETLDGYIFNREALAHPPQLQMFLKDQTAPRVIPYADVATIAFTGKDTANGKSWLDWVNKKKHEREAEADKIKAEVSALGHL